MKAGIQSLRAGFLTLAAALSVVQSAVGPLSAQPVTGPDLEQAVLRHSLYRDPELERLFHRANAARAKGDIYEALEIYQKILAGKSDAVLWVTQREIDSPSDRQALSGSSMRLRSIRREVRLRLEELIKTAPELYERTHEQQAQLLLKEAKQASSQALLEEVDRRFFETRAGFDTLELLATRCLDRNSPEQSARLFRKLLQSRVHRSRITGSVVFKAACALHLSGNPEAVQQLLEDSRQFQMTPAQLAEIEESISRLAAAPRSETLSAEWRTPYGSVAHNGSGTGTIPWLNPVWSQPLAADTPLSCLANWERSRMSDELKEIGSTTASLLVNDQLIVRDFEGIRAVAPRTGKRLWHFDTTMTIPGFSRAIQTTGYTKENNTLAQLAWFGNSMLTEITSDGERIFAVDLLRFSTAADSGNVSRVNEIQAQNRLVCLRIPGQQGVDTDETAPAVPHVEWHAGGSPDPSPADPLAGHMFLGPPLPVGGVLFAITESQRELSLVKLDAATGRVAWIQRFGLVEQPLFHDSQRHRAFAPYLPTYADGIVVCPTGTGVLVGIDSLFGEIVWARYCGQMERSPFRGASMTLSKRPLDFPGLPSSPVASGDSLICMPRVSDRVQCLDLTTGERIWSTGRKDTLYIGSVTEQGVLLIGRSHARLLSLLDGHEIWSQPISTPAGRGVRSGTNYMLPLKSGGVTALRIDTGLTHASVERLHEWFAASDSPAPAFPDPDQVALSEFGLTQNQIPSHMRPGNLLLYDGLVISTGPRHITAFQQAESLMHELYVSPRKSEADVQLLTAQLELSTGRIDTAEKRLTRLLKQNSIPQLKSARGVLQGLMLRQLRGPRGTLDDVQRRHMIQTLQQLAETPDEKWQTFVEQMRASVDRGDWAEVLPGARTLATSSITSFVQQSAPDTVVRTDVWGQSLLAHLRSSDQSIDWNSLSQRDASELKSNSDTASLHRFLQLHRTGPLAARVRNRLADRLISQGSFQQAELLLLENRKTASGEARAITELLLVSLWDQLGLHGEAGIALSAFERQFGDTPLPSISADRLSTLSRIFHKSPVVDQVPDGHAIIATFDRDSATWKVFNNLQPVAWPIRRVVVRKFSFDSTRPELASTWTSGRVLPMGGRSGYNLLRQGDLNSTQWILVDRYSGSEQGRIAMPGRTTRPVVNQYKMIGHFMPIGSPARMIGVSMIEHRNRSPAWSLCFPRIPSDNLVEAGPATPGVCVFQTQKHLIGIHPGTGRVLWRKSDLDLKSGVYVDKEAGLFGDEKILIMFHADQQTWTKLSTQTGQVLDRGRLDVEFRYQKSVYGRKLLHVMKNLPDESRKQLRVWDPLTDTSDFNEPVEGRYYVADSADSRLMALLTAERRLRVFQMPDVTVIADVLLTRDQMEGVSALRIFADDGTLFVNTQRTVNLKAQDKYHYLATDSTLPADHVQQGSLIALDRTTGRVLWSRHCRQQTFLRFDRARLPFLVSLSRVRPRNRTNIHGIELEVIDRRTGELLGHHTHLIQDRFVHTHVDRQQGLLQIYGLSSRVDLDFSPKTQRILMEQLPL